MNRPNLIEIGIVLAVMVAAAILILRYLGV